jgi:hypothetical protein
MEAVNFQLEAQTFLSRDIMKIDTLAYGLLIVIISLFRYMPCVSSWYTKLQGLMR